MSCCFIALLDYFGVDHDILDTHASNKTTCVCCNDDMFYSNITYGQLDEASSSKHCFTSSRNVSTDGIPLPTFKQEDFIVSELSLQCLVLLDHHIHIYFLS